MPAAFFLLPKESVICHAIGAPVGPPDDPRLTYSPRDGKVSP